MTAPRHPAWDVKSASDADMALGELRSVIADMEHLRVHGDAPSKWRELFARAEQAARVGEWAASWADETP